MSFKDLNKPIMFGARSHLTLMHGFVFIAVENYFCSPSVSLTTTAKFYKLHAKIDNVLLENYKPCLKKKKQQSNMLQSS